MKLLWILAQAASTQSREVRPGAAYKRASRLDELKTPRPASQLHCSGPDCPVDKTNVMFEDPPGNAARDHTGPVGSFHLKPMGIAP